jgi:vanadium-dependent haloperoxidase-like protein
LTDEQKMIAEYWADGPHSELPPGHWDLFAQFVSRRDHHGAHKSGIDADVKLFFALTNAIFDAGICCWDNKRFFDSVRPITAIRYLFRGQRVRAWGGPYQGTRSMDGADWLPYQAPTFPTPAFPEYSSGHSTFSAAGAEILRLFTGSDRFGGWVTFPAGSSKFELGRVPAADMTLRWETFSDAANQAGLSRRYGGIHFEQGDLDGRAAGRLVARLTWAKAQSYIDGTAR